MGSGQKSEFFSLETINAPATGTTNNMSLIRTRLGVQKYNYRDERDSQGCVPLHLLPEDNNMLEVPLFPLPSWGRPHCLLFNVSCA